MFRKANAALANLSFLVEVLEIFHQSVDGTADDMVGDHLEWSDCGHGPMNAAGASAEFGVVQACFCEPGTLLNLPSSGTAFFSYDDLVDTPHAICGDVAHRACKLEHRFEQCHGRKVWFNKCLNGNSDIPYNVI